MTFWDRFYDLCIENETKPNPECKKLGFSNSASTHWKAGQLPGATSLKKLLITLMYLLITCLEKQI